MTDDPWLKTSIMAKRGVAKGQAGRRHELSIEKQGPFHYVYGPYTKPVLTIEPGDVVAVETEDAFGGVITSEKDSPTAKLQFPFLNPQCGPIAVNGIEKGDCLAVHVHAVETRGAQPAGKTCIIPEFGGLVGTASTAMLNPPLPERVRVMHVDKNGVRWSDKITLPYQPFIGTIGISPEIEAISSLQPDYHGGNMDLPDVAPGAILYFPVHVKGGFLYVGDCHAAQGDGELSGVAIEQRATVTMQIDVIKGWGFAWPRLETKDFVMTIGSARPLEDAARRIEGWLLESGAQLRTGPHRGGVAGWLDRDGRPKFVYLEITGYYLTMAAWLAGGAASSEERRAMALEHGRQAVDWMRSVTADGAVPPTRLEELSGLEFHALEEERFPSVRLAREAAVAGHGRPAVLNAANEEAVAAFLDGRIPFTAIAESVREVLDDHLPSTLNRLEDVLEADAWARERSREALGRRGALRASS